MNIEKDKIKKILVFKLCCLGDILMMTPTINALKQNFPDAEITLIASLWVKRITDYLKNIDSVITEDVFFEKSFLKKVTGVTKLIFKLRKSEFDLVFLGHRNSVFGLISRLSGIKYRLGFCQTKFINYCEPFDEKIHEVIRYLNVLKSIGIKPDIKPLELKLKYPLSETKKTYGIDEEKFVIGIFPFGGINPGTEMSIKRWDIKIILY
ncbi:MAG: hypothetical protein IPL53_06955 [Ignavibacteria bacterium]|nr:hypothetical protein [Ignavibacteria bacterium]